MVPSIRNPLGLTLLERSFRVFGDFSTKSTVDISCRERAQHKIGSPRKQKQNKAHVAFNEKQRFERIFAQEDARFLPEKTKWDLNEFCSNRFVLHWFLSSCRFSGRLTTEEEPYDCVRTINHSEAHTRLQQAAPFTRKYNVPRYNQTLYLFTHKSSYLLRYRSVS